jgi:hypothetical protein
MGWKCNKCGKLINFSVDETWHGSGTEVIDGYGEREIEELFPDDSEINCNCDCDYKDFHNYGELYEYLKKHAKYEV